jgi:hypothetical protein
MAEAKIDQFRPMVGVKQDVLRLNVPVDNPTIMQIGEGIDKLGEHIPNRIIVESAVLLDVRAEITANAVLHDDVHKRRINDDIEYSHDIRMGDLLENANCSPEARFRTRRATEKPPVPSSWTISYLSKVCGISNNPTSQAKVRVMKGALFKYRRGDCMIILP